MAWQCPNCGREFRISNQLHSCELISIDNHFENRPLHLHEFFDLLRQKIEGFGPVTINALKSSILFQNPSSFLSVTVKKTKLQLVFILDHPHESPVIERVYEVTPSRVHHSLHISCENDISDELIFILRLAYDAMVT